MNIKLRQAGLAVIALASASTLSSCIIKQGVELFIRDSYPGERPPMVIKDVDGKPANENWLTPQEDELPPPSFIAGKIDYAKDGLPYGKSGEFSHTVISPYAPNYPLDYTGISAGSKVWDPYARKAFYIPWSFTFN